MEEIDLRWPTPFEDLALLRRCMCIFEVEIYLDKGNSALWDSLFSAHVCAGQSNQEDTDGEQDRKMNRWLGSKSKLTKAVDG